MLRDYVTSKSDALTSWSYLIFFYNSWGLFGESYFGVPKLDSPKEVLYLNLVESS